MFAQSTDGLLEGRARVFGNEAILVIHLPRAIQELPDFYASLGIGSAQRSGGNIQDQVSQAYGIIQSHFGGVVETNGPVHIERFGYGAPSFLGLEGSDRKPVVKSPDEGWQEVIALGKGGNLGQAQFRPQAVLESGKEPLDPPFGLGR